jgi:hypothetical protein
MARYFFDLRDGDHLAVDEEGIELPSLERVQEEAASSLAEMARERVIEAARNGAHDMAIEVRDEDGPLMKVQFTFAGDRTRH